MKKKKHNTIFDDVFRTMVQKMPQLLIPLINEIFDSNYSEDEVIQQLRNEYIEKFGKISTDSILLIRDKTYHIECQSTKDHTMAIRMFEYDFAIALEQSMKFEGIYELNFPESGVLSLRGNDTVPDYLKVTVNFSQGKSFIYEVPVIQAQAYTRNAIFEKKLLFLLPYYILRYESRLKEISADSNKLAALLDDYQYIRTQLEKEFAEMERSALYTDLQDLIIQIADYVLRNEKQIREGVNEIMGGKVLELKSERLIRIGKAEGKAEGKTEVLVNLVRKGLLVAGIAASELGMTEDEFLKVMEQMQKIN